jgi:hypothetical protein
VNPKAFVVCPWGSHAFCPMFMKLGEAHVVTDKLGKISVLNVQKILFNHFPVIPPITVD